MDDRTTTSFARTQPLQAAAPKERRWLPVLVLLAAAVAVGWWFYPREGAQSPARRGYEAAVVLVVAAPAAMGDIDITLNALGTVTSPATVTMKSQISGQLVRVAYQEGQMVNKGDLLAEIDSRPYELALTQAQGAIERDQAMLQGAELDLKRYQDLVKTNAIPRQQLDQQQALVLQDRGLVMSDQAQIDTQKLNIAYCHIVAPVSGRVGLRLVDQGNYVTPGDAAGIAVIAQLRPISVVFTVAEDNLPQIVKRLRAETMLPVTAFDRGGATKLATGELKTLDNQIDTTTGTLKLRAEFANEDEILFPNQFVNIKLLVDVLHDTTIVPTSAIQRGAPGTFVYLVNTDNTVTVRPVMLGPTSGDRAAVQSGLSPGDLVVIDGADQLHNGARITLRDPNVGGAPGAATPPGAGSSIAPRARGRGPRGRKPPGRLTSRDEAERQGDNLPSSSGGGSRRSREPQ
jgi:multidrug efflux system membrane fusion protein